MSVSHRLNHLRAERASRRAARTERDALIRELSGYATPTDRAELELIISRSADPQAEHLLDVLNQLPVSVSRSGLHRSA